MLIKKKKKLAKYSINLEATILEFKKTNKKTGQASCNSVQMGGAREICWHDGRQPHDNEFAFREYGSSKG